MNENGPKSETRLDAVPFCADIIEWLRHMQKYDDCGPAFKQAADEIERLRAALQRIADEDSGIMGGIAWAALEISEKSS